MYHSRVGLAPRLFCAAVLGLLLGCDSSSTTPLQQKSPDAPPPPPPTPRAAVIHVTTYTPDIYVGSTRQLTIVASDANGNPINTDQADVQLSDARVAVVTASNTVTRRNTNGVTTLESAPTLRMVGAGVVVARVTMDGVSDSVSLKVNEVVTGLFPLVVDSFRVVEYGVKCTGGCSFVAYAPLLRLREPTGNKSIEVVAVEFTMGSKSTGFCEGSVNYGPGMTAELNGIDDYIWSNDLIFVNADGSPIPGDSASGRVVVKVADGAYNELDITGPVLRNVANPMLPPPRANGWFCH
jgi:hypothetical protein